jgi:hypothetical protein
MKSRGWRNESARHSLSSRGVKTGHKTSPRITIPGKFAKENATVWKSKDFGARFIITSKLMESGVKSPRDDGSGYMSHNKYKVTVTNWDNKKKTSFYWYGSHNDYMNNVTKMDDHDILFSVASWLENASSACTQDFEGWAGDFGYDEDSVKAMKIYKENEKNGKKIDELLGPEYGADVWGAMGQEILKSIGE